MKTFYLLILMLSSCFQLYSQLYQLNVRHLTVEDGLPNNVVDAAFQDQDGFVWIGTNFGYCRYDGKNIDSYRQKYFGEKITPISNRVSNIFQDPMEKIWIDYGRWLWTWLPDKSTVIEIMDPVNKSVRSFDHYFGNKAPFKMQDIRYLRQHLSSPVWIMTIDGAIYKYDGAFRKIIQLPASLLPQIDAETLVIASEEVLWIVMPSMIYEVYDDGRLVSTIMQKWYDKRIPSYRVNFHNELWMVSSEIPGAMIKKPGAPLQVLSLKEKNLPPIPAISNNTFLLLKDKDGHLWYIYENQIYVFDQAGKLLLQDSLVDYQAIYNHVFFDNLGQLWICTQNDGIYIFSIQKIPFRNYRILPNKKIADFRGIAVDSNNTIYSNLGGTTAIIGNQERPISKEQWGGATGILIDGNVIWCAGYDDVVLKTNLKEEVTHMLYYDIDKEKPYTNPQGFYTNVLHKSNKTGRIWVGGYLFFGYINDTKDSLKLYTKYSDFPEMKDRAIQFFHENKEGIWVCTDKGIYLLDEQKGIIASFKKFSDYNITHLYEDEQGIFWIATRGDGLLRWNRKADEITSFTQKDGFTSDVVYCVYEDDYGYLWLPSNYGLMRFHKITHEFRNYLPKDGIPHHEFNYNSHAKGPDGRFYFGGLKGLTSFHPKDFIENKNNNAPFRVISLKKLDQQSGALKDFTANFLTTRQIILHPNERSIFLEVALLNYQNSRQNRYIYRVEDLEKEWKYLDGNSVNIGGLPYGKYKLHLKAKDINGIWAKQELFIPITILRPFYLQFWFIGLIIIILTALVFAFFHWRTTRLIKEKQLLEIEVMKRTTTIEEQTRELLALNEQKSRYFLNIAHDLRTPLTFITTPIAIFLEEEQLNDRVKSFLKSIQRNAAHLLGLVESILNLSKLEQQPLELEEEVVNFSKLIQLNFNMYDSYAKMHHIEYRVNYNASEDLHLSLDKKKFEKILLNLLANALKYNVKKGSVCLFVNELPDTIEIKVQDTGIGIHPDDLPHIFERYYQSRQRHLPIQGGSGIGLAIVSEYAKMMNATIKVESKIGKGSIFTLVMPKKVAAPQAIIPQPTNGYNTALAKSPVLIEPIANTFKNNSYTVLIVEDNVEMQQLLKDIIGPSFNIRIAENGESAIKVLSKHSISCIITDIMMPEMDGFEFIQAIKKKPIWQQIPIIALTARANETDKIEALRMGIDDYMYKPFSAKELLVRIENLLTNFQNRQKSHATEMEYSEELLSADQQWLQHLEESIAELLTRNPEFNLIDLALQINISERHLRRKILELTGMNAKDYIKEFRLQKARYLLEQKAMNTISEISYSVGFSAAGYFSKVYYERFGKKPAEYL